MADIIEEVEEVVVPDQPVVEDQEKVEANLEKELTPIKEDPVVQEEKLQRKKMTYQRSIKGSLLKRLQKCTNKLKNLLANKALKWVNLER